MSEDIILSPNTYLRVTDEKLLFPDWAKCIVLPKDPPSSFVITSDFGFLFCEYAQFKTKNYQ